ncbi:putative long chain fatty acyl CoA synthetase having a signal peptide [Cryptosporidium canis]|uniref:Long chain fatty acyl CoA synthetase having a signal peptide n=1 Tax=Cryptosporidium canis TaxID=195482 RepID=A0A9D5DJW4_9CRYT|nr:putative long chain fatty acyl CoA synthetase having a signal peptide [Cryptosporidium canis]
MKVLRLALLVFVFMMSINLIGSMKGKYYLGRWKNTVHSVAVEGTDDHPMMSAIYRHREHKTELISNFEDTVSNLIDIIKHGMVMSLDGYLYGRRQAKKTHDYDPISKLAESDDAQLAKKKKKKGIPLMEWFRYSSVLRLAGEFGSGLLSLKDSVPFVDHSPDISKPIRVVSIFTKNRLEWSLTEIACSTFGIVLSPMYDSLGPDGVAHSINLVGSSTIVVSMEALKTILGILSDLPKIRYVVLLRPEDGGDVSYPLDKVELTPDSLTAYGVQVTLSEYNIPSSVKFLTFEAVMRLGESNMKEPTPSNYDDVNSIYFTSGTTGVPKGAIHTNGNWIAGASASLRSFLNRSDCTLGPHDRYLSFLPLAHIFEREVHHILTYSGSTICFYGGDILKLGEDMKAVRPTIFVAVPRLFSRIYKGKVLQEVRKKSDGVQKFFFKILKRKVHSRHPVKHWVYDAITFKKISSVLGGKIKFTLSGAAPLDEHTQRDMRALLRTHVVQGYGTTEALAAFCPEFTDLSVNNVGGPIPCIEFRFLSIPEMEYDAKSYPIQGELLIRGKTIFNGYLKQPEETAKTIDEDGWLHTGDIAELTDSGAIRIIDRRKHLFKLSQGEYISPETLENIYLAHSPVVGQMFITAKTTESVIVAIIVPDPDYVRDFSAKKGVPISQDWKSQFAQMCNEANLKYFKEGVNTPLRSEIIASMKQVEESQGIKGFKKVNDFYLESEGFTIENGLLTPTNKLMRHKANKAYQDKVEELYVIINKKMGGRP